MKKVIIGFIIPNYTMPRIVVVQVQKTRLRSRLHSYQIMLAF